jgi:hypothetical protein
LAKRCAYIDAFASESNPGRRSAFRKEAVKWGILLTLIVFAITLQDRHADILAASSLLVGTLLNPPFPLASRSRRVPAN